MGTLKHIVLFNGYSLAENPDLAGVVKQNGEPRSCDFGDWHEVCWGDDLRPGRIPVAVRLAAALDAAHLVWSTGATWTENGVSEATYSFAAALQNRKLLSEVGETWMGEKWLRGISIIEDRSTNTATTMKAVKEFIQEQYADQTVMLHPVSSANHMPRVWRDMIKMFDGMPNVLLPSAATCYGKKTMDDVVIYECGEPPKVTV